MNDSPYIIDVNETTFSKEVIERSRQAPVVVDFWAAWCGPCRTLGPVLEKVAREYSGAFILAKLDVDANPRLSQQYRIQGIPAVKAFRHGSPVSEFVGALPEPRVRDFIRGLIPNDADRLAARGAAAEGANRLAEALNAYQGALTIQADHSLALLGLGRVLLAQGQYQQARETLARVPPNSPQGEEAGRLAVQARLMSEAVQLGNESELVARVSANGSGGADTLAAKLALGKLRISQGRYEDGMELFLQIVATDRKFQDGAARIAMTDVFALLGDQDERTIAYRKRLSNLLY